MRINMTINGNYSLPNVFIFYDVIFLCTLLILKGLDSWLLMSSWLTVSENQISEFTYHQQLHLSSCCCQFCFQLYNIPSALVTGMSSTPTFDFSSSQLQSHHLLGTAGTAAAFQRCLSAVAVGVIEAVVLHSFWLFHLQDHRPFKSLCLNHISLVRPRGQKSKGRGWILFWALLLMYNTRLGSQQSLLSSAAETEKTGMVITNPILTYKAFWNSWLRGTI